MHGDARAGQKAPSESGPTETIYQASPSARKILQEREAPSRGNDRTGTGIRFRSQYDILLDDVPALVSLGLEYIDEARDVDTSVAQREEETLHHGLAEIQIARANPLRQVPVEILEVNVGDAADCSLSDVYGVGAGESEMSGVDAQVHEGPIKHTVNVVLTNDRHSPVGVECHPQPVSRSDLDDTIKTGQERVPLRLGEIYLAIVPGVVRIGSEHHDRGTEAREGCGCTLYIGETLGDQLGTVEDCGYESAYECEVESAEKNS